MFYFATFKEMKQYTNHIIMIKPIKFQYNSETAVNNFYQKNSAVMTEEEVQSMALDEFNNLVKKLERHSVKVTVFNDVNLDTPDSVFPNNWISTHQEGDVCIYPMFAKNRRKERRNDILEYLKENFLVTEFRDYVRDFEGNNMFLEGTGSMVLDRINKIAYASISGRTHKDVFLKWCIDMKFNPVSFSAFQLNKDSISPIYHTNVMMSIADSFAIICLDSIIDLDDREKVQRCIEDSKKEIINITQNQVVAFAGNMLQVIGDKKYLVMSTSAYNSLTIMQIEQIQKHCAIIHSPLDTIELFGGGSARCMMAEVFLKEKR